MLELPQESLSLPTWFRSTTPLPPLSKKCACKQGTPSHTGARDGSGSDFGAATLVVPGASCSYSPPSPLVNTQADEDENVMLTQALEPEQEPKFCPCPFPHMPCTVKWAHIVSPVETDVIDGTCSSLGDRRNLPESTSPGEGLSELGDGVLQIRPDQKLGTMLTTPEVEHTAALLPLQAKERDHRGPATGCR